MSNRAQIIAYIPRLRRYARALVGERAAADDLVQDTLERALVKFHLWKPGTDLRAWLFTIMHNVNVNQRRARRELSTIDDEVLELPAHDAADAGVRGRDLERALSALPIGQREVLLLVTLEDMSYQDVADLLGIPIGTVMSRLSRAREKVRTALEGSTLTGRLQVIK